MGNEESAKEWFREGGLDAVQVAEARVDGSMTCGAVTVAAQSPCLDFNFRPVEGIELWYEIRMNGLQILVCFHDR